MNTTQLLTNKKGYNFNIFCEFVNNTKVNIYYIKDNLFRRIQDGFEIYLRFKKSIFSKI